jgi:hypothetical protein
MRGVYMSVAEGEVNTRTTRLYEEAIRREGMFVNAIFRRAPHRLSNPLFEEQRIADLHASRLAYLDSSLGGPFGAAVLGGAMLILAAPLNPDEHNFDMSMDGDLQAMHDTARVVQKHKLPVFTFRYPGLEKQALERMHISHLHTDEALVALEAVTQQLPPDYEVGPIKDTLISEASYAA